MHLARLQLTIKVSRRPIRAVGLDRDVMCEETMSQIPEKYLEFCKAVAALAREADIEKVTLTAHPDVLDTWRSTIEMHWEQGRHGEDSRRCFISSTVRIRADITHNLF